MKSNRKLMAFWATRAPRGQKLPHMLRSSDVSNDAKLNRHANVTDVTQKAHGCRFYNLGQR